MRTVARSLRTAASKSALRMAAIVTLTAVAVTSGPTLIANADIRNNGYNVGGRILQEYQENQSLGFNYGLARSAELDAARGGKFQRFDGGNIYWHDLVSNSHANTVGGRIFDKWGQFNWEQGVLKYPTTREVRLSGGSFNHFEGGSIYWSQPTDAHVVFGAIREKWFQTGAENNLGYPVNDEVALSRYNGKLSAFQRGSIYYTASTGAKIVGGEIGKIWGAAGWEGGNYGYPVSDEIDIPGGKRQIFQGGPIDWYFDGRPVGAIRMSTFRFQNFILDKNVAARCDPFYANLTPPIASEVYGGENRSWDPEGSFRDRTDITVLVDQANRGNKISQIFQDTSPTTQYIDTRVDQRTFTRKAPATNMTASRLPVVAGDYPDVTRFKVENLTTNPFCNLPNSGIKADFSIGFSASSAQFSLIGGRRRMPSAEAYIKDWVTPGTQVWQTVGRWPLLDPFCLASDNVPCATQSLDTTSGNWNGGRIRVN